MAYTPTVWVNNTAPAMSATNLNKLTNELELQAAEKAIAHTLPTWADGAAPAITDAAPWNEMERVADQVASSVGLSYTRTNWSNGWTPARNDTRLNKLENQVAANRTALDAVPSDELRSPFGYIRLPSPPVYPQSHGSYYELLMGMFGSPIPAGSDPDARRLRYVAFVDAQQSHGNFGLSGSEVLNNPGWVLRNSAGTALVNKNHTDSYLTNVTNAGARARWISNVLTLIDTEAEGIFVDDTAGNYVALTPSQQLDPNVTEAQWRTGAITFTHEIHAALSAVNKYVVYNCGIFKPGDSAYDNPVNHLIPFWQAIGPGGADGLMSEYWMSHNGMPLAETPNKMRVIGTGWHQRWTEYRQLHQACNAMGVDFVPLDYSSTGSPDVALLKRYARATWLLDWDGTLGAHTWHNSNADPWTAIDDTILAMGAPVGAATLSGSTWTRQFEDGTITVNPNGPSPAATITAT